MNIVYSYKCKILVTNLKPKGAKEEQPDKYFWETDYDEGMELAPRKLLR